MKKEIFDKYNIKFSEIRKVIEPYIVDFYGQDKAQEISKRLDRIVLNNYFSLKDIQSFVRKNQEMKRRKLTLDFLESFDENVSFTQEEKNKMIYDSNEYVKGVNDEQKIIIKGVFDSIQGTFSENNFAPIYSLFKDQELEEGEELSEYQIKDIRQKTCKVLNVLGLEITLDNYEEVLSKTSSKEVIEKAKKIKETALKLKEEFWMFSMQFEEEEKYFRECEELKQELSLREIKAFYSEIIPFVDEETKKKVQEALSEDIKETWKFMQKVDKDRKYMGTSLTFSGKIKKEELGISAETIQKIEECREKHKEIVEEEFLAKTSSYENNIELIESLGLKIEDNFDLEFMQEGVICCCPNYVEIDGKEEPICLMHIPLYDDVKMLSRYKDTMFMHEVLHVVEMTSKKIDDETYEFKSGFDFMQEKVKGKKVINENKDEKRRTELFSENIHQRNATDITEKMHESGVYLFNNPYTAEVRGGTSYEYLELVTKDFYYKYKDKIKEARFQDTLTTLTEIIGIENFEELNNVVNEYAKIPYISMCRDLNEGKTTELTLKRDLLYEASKHIVSRMDQRNKNKPEINDEDIII